MRNFYLFCLISLVCCCSLFAQKKDKSAKAWGLYAATTAPSYNFSIRHPVLHFITLSAEAGVYWRNLITVGASFNYITQLDKNKNFQYGIGWSALCRLNQLKTYKYNTALVGFYYLLGISGMYYYSSHVNTTPVRVYYNHTGVLYKSVNTIVGIGLTTKMGGGFAVFAEGGYQAAIARKRYSATTGFFFLNLGFYYGF